jgi:hypothetical protein
VVTVLHTGVTRKRVISVSNLFSITIINADR